MILVKTYHQNIIYTVQLLAECVTEFFQSCKTLTEGELTNKMIQLTESLIAFDTSQINTGRYRLFAANLCIWMTYLLRFDAQNTVREKLSALLEPKIGLMFELWVSSGGMFDKSYTKNCLERDFWYILDRPTANNNHTMKIILNNASRDPEYLSKVQALASKNAFTISEALFFRHNCSAKIYDISEQMVETYFAKHILIGLTDCTDYKKVMHQCDLIIKWIEYCMPRMQENLETFQRIQWLFNDTCSDILGKFKKQLELISNPHTEISLP